MRHIAKSNSMRALVHAVVSVIFCYALFNASNSVVLAGPEGAEVIHGRVSFQKNGLNTVITASDKSIVNYKSFNISRPEAVQFVQPHSNASVLNRINSASPTHINGTLTANGRVFFVNPAGVYIGNGAKINVNQLVASGLNISNSDFINGKYLFSGGHGSVENRGDITAEKVHLIGKQVANYGTINCPGGYVVMAAGDRVFLGKPGNDLTVQVDPEPLPESTDLDMGVRNDGTINAAGGQIVLAAAGDIYSQAISNVGTLSASVQDGDAGKVKLIAKNGNINNKGSIKTTSKSGKGGTVTTEGSEVINSGTVDVTGSEGGQVALKGKRVGQFGAIHADGVNSHGGNVTLTADEVVALGSESLTTANAGLNGNGGDVTVSSHDSTLFRSEAKIEAKGGSESGDGGFIEVSGKEHVEIYGLADVSANNGDEGTFFIDPHNVTIQNGPGSLDNGGNPFEAGSDGDAVSDDAIESVINTGGAAVIQTSGGGLEDGDIIQDADATIDFTGAGGDASLILNAADDVELNGGITASGAAITVTINANDDYDTASGEGDVDINADIATNGGDFTSSGIDFDNTGGEIHTDGGNVNLDGHTGDINIGANIVADTGDISAISGSSVLVRNQASGITAGNVDIDTTGRFACEPGSRITAGGDGTDLNVNAGHIDLNANGVGNETLTNTGNGTITLTASGDTFLSDHSINVDKGTVDIYSANIITAESTGSEIKANGLVSLTAGAIGDRDNPLDLDGADELEITTIRMEDNYNGGEIQIKENTSTITSTTIYVVDPLRDRIYIDYAEVNGNDDEVDIGFDPPSPSHYIYRIDLDNDSGSSFSYTAGTGNIHLITNYSDLAPINMGENGDVTLSTPDRIDFYDSGLGLTPITTAGGSVNLTASEISSYSPDGSAPLGIQGASALTLTDTGPGAIELEEVGDSTIGLTSITVGNVDYGTIDITYNDEGSWLYIDDDHFINSAFLPSSFSYMAEKGDITLGAGELPINIGYNGDVTLITSDNIVFPDWWGQGPLIITNGGSVSLTADGIYSYTDDGPSLTLPLGIQGATALTLTDTGPGPMWLEEVGGSTIGSTSITVGDIGYGTIDIAYYDERNWLDIDDNHFINSAFPPSSFSYTATQGDIHIGLVDAGTGNVTLDSNGAIRDAVDDQFEPDADIIGATIDLTARSGGIGTPIPDRDDDEPMRILEVTATQELNADTTADSGDILIGSIGNLPLGLVDGGSGDVTLDSTGAIRDAVDDSLAFKPYVDVDVVGGTIDLTAQAGGIGTPVLIEDDGIGFENRVLEVMASHELNADTTADGGEIYINSTDDLPLGLVNAKKDAGTIGHVTLVSIGSINDASDDKDVDIAGSTVTLMALDEIGSNPIDGKTEDIYGAIETDATRLEAQSNNGDIVIVEKDDVKLGGILADAGSVFLEAINGAMIHEGEMIKAGTGITLESSGNITTNDLHTSEGNISVHSKDGDLIVNGNVTASNGGVSIIADNGKIYTEPSDSDNALLSRSLPTLNVDITGYSDDVTHRQDLTPGSFVVGSRGGVGVVLPDGTGKAAIVIRSKDDLKLGPNAILTAGGTYVAGHATVSLTAGGTYVAGRKGGVDDRPGVGFKSTGEGSGDPIDVAIYVGSYGFKSRTGGNVTVDSDVRIDPGGTMVIDAENTVNAFGPTFINSWGKNNDGTNGLEVVSRITQTLNQAVNLGTLPYAEGALQERAPFWPPSQKRRLHPFGDSNYVLRGKRVAEVLRSVAEVPRSTEVPPLENLDGEDEEYVRGPSAEEFREEAEPLPLLVLRGGKYVKAQRNMVLELGDEIKTPPGMTAFIQFHDGSEIIMIPETHTVIENPTIFAKLGKIIARVRAKFKVRTKYVTAGVKGTLFTVDVGKDGVTVIKVIEGNIVLDPDPNDSNENRWPSVPLGPGKQARIWRRQKPQIELIRMSEYKQIVSSITALERDIAEIPKVTEGIAVLRDFKFGGIEGIIKDDYSLFNVWH